MKRGPAIVGSALLLAAAAAVWLLRTDRSPEPTPSASDLAAQRGPAQPDPATAKPGLERAAPRVGGGGASGTPAAQPNGPHEEQTPGSVAVHVVGRVVDDRRRPIAKAIATLHLGWVPSAGAAHETASSGEDGRFRIAATVAERGAWTSGAVLVVDPSGRTALAPVGFVASTLGDVDAGVIELGPASAVEVRVREGAAPASGVRVIAFFVVHPSRVPVGSETTDAEGRVRFAAIPPGFLQLYALSPSGSQGRGESPIPREGTKPVEIELKPERTLAVRVLLGEDDKPVAGALVRAMIELRTGEHSISVLPCDPPLDIPPTDAEGRTTVRGLCAGDSLRLYADVPGSLSQGSQEVKPTDESLDINISSTRTVSWPVEAGEQPIPPDGTVIPLRPWPLSDLLPGTGRMRGSRLVAEGVPSGSFEGLAVAPDGSLAELHAKSDGAEGAATSFHRPRRIEVRIVEEGGVQGVTGIGVQVRGDNGNPWSQPIRTDSEGRAAFDGLPALAFKVNACVTADDSWGVEIGDADAKSGDAHVEWTLGAARTLEVRVHVEGEARFPSGMKWSVDALTESAEEDATSGVLRLRVRPHNPTEVGTLAVNAPGFEEANTELAWAAPGTPTVASVDLERTGSVVVTVSARTGVQLLVRLQRRSDVEKAWKTLDYRVRTIDAPGVSRIDSLLPGIYRLDDLGSGLVSAPFTVARGGEPATASLDLSTTYEVSGRVDFPEGYPKEAWVVSEGKDIDTTSEFGPGKPCKGDGTFRITVPGDRPVTVRVSHPSLKPSPHGGSLVVTGPRDDVVLTLIEGATAVFRLAPPPGVERDPKEESGMASLYAGALAGPPASMHEILLDAGNAKFTGFAPGTYTLLLNLPPFAPQVLPDVALKEGKTDLGAVKFEAGTTVRVRFLTKDGKPPRDVYGIAERQGEPSYERLITGTAGDLRIHGLGAGKFLLRVTWTGQGDFEEEKEQTVEVDGRGEVTIDLDVR